MLFRSRVLSNAAIATLDPQDLRLLGLTKKGRIWLRLAYVGLITLRAILGYESPSQRLARQRIPRLRARASAGVATPTSTTAVPDTP